MAEILEHETKEEWLSSRNETANASEVAKILGTEEGAFQLAAEKMSRVSTEDLSDNERVEWGLRLEAVICNAYAERFDAFVRRPPPFTMQRSTEWPWLSCTPDAFTCQTAAQGTWGVEYKDEGPHLQIKTCDAYRKKEWDGEPPLKFQVQVQTELAVLQRERAYLVVLFGGNELERFEIVRNEKFIAVMVTKTKEFMDAVKAGVMPAVDGSLSTKRTLALLHPKDSGKEVELPEEATFWASYLTTAKETIKLGEAAKRGVENRLRAAIGDATFGVLPDGSRFSLETTSKKGHVVKPSTFRTLRKMK